MFRFRCSFTCPECGAASALSPDSSRRIAVIAGLTFALVILLVGPFRIMSWPALPAFVIFALLYPRVLTLGLGVLAVGPRPRDVTLFAGESPTWRVAYVTKVAAVSVLAILGLALQLSAEVRSHAGWLAMMLVPFALLQIVVGVRILVVTLFPKRSPERDP